MKWQRRGKKNSRLKWRSALRSLLPRRTPGINCRLLAQPNRDCSAPNRRSVWLSANRPSTKIIKEGFVTLHINFDFGKASIKQESIPLIVQIIEMLKLAPDLSIEVDGHTDNVGGEKANQALSEARAESVVRTLITSGVPAARLTAVGYGQSKPVADNRTAEGRSKNRRVELRKR